MAPVEFMIPKAQMSPRSDAATVEYAFHPPSGYSTVSRGSSSNTSVEFSTVSSWNVLSLNMLGFPDWNAEEEAIGRESYSS
ncbi:hypothetical protein OGAPHI_000992 [Ogataea philodendri]|uniref:Uncharacterized protein n=1 Tax=Ogataea philodendri TaxID=1378263 RepID=A0A9P8PEP0_9ASCO|nr:uncharacterized protein OGAPHI_000992 [Ogataea philodendri]KAH3670477.1 hypothetical protein OGAPHI_000992 [Ogataea philodendri]